MVEGTAGNTGIGLAHLCKALGYKCVIFMPNTQSKVCYHVHWNIQTEIVCLPDTLLVSLIGNQAWLIFSVYICM